MASSIDEYIARQRAIKHRIKETKKSITFWRNRTGLARHAARDKINNLKKLLEMLEWAKENDCLPWEPGPTLEMDSLANYYLRHDAQQP